MVQDLYLGHERTQGKGQGGDLLRVHEYDPVDRFIGQILGRDKGDRSLVYGQEIAQVTIQALRQDGAGPWEEARRR